MPTQRDFEACKFDRMKIFSPKSFQPIKDDYNLIGWQTIDIYQNLSITFLYSISKNKILEKNLFKLPIQN